MNRNKSRRLRGVRGGFAEAERELRLITESAGEPDFLLGFT